MAIYKSCDYCHKRLKPGTVCDCIRKRRGKEKITDSFYLSKQWDKARTACIGQCFGLDVYAFYKYNRIEYGDTVHHIKPLKDYPELATEQSNLIYVSNKSHAEIHERYKDDFNNAEKELREMKQRFVREYGGMRKCFA